MNASSKMAAWLLCLLTGISVQAATPAFDQQRWSLPDEPLLGFVEIPAGGFIMGSDPLIDPAAFENERWSPQRRQGRVELDTFYIGRYEVTAGQFRAFMADSNYRNGELEIAGDAAQPATGITWPDALAYASWLERMLRDSPATPESLRSLLNEGWKITLPTEGQWEKAARGFGSRIYPWGNQFDPALASVETGRAEPDAVGSHDCAECAYELADMSGNVWELTRSPYQEYPWNPDDNHLTADGDALWIMRGGSFSDAPNLARISVRGAVQPGVRRENIGFRLVLARD